MIQKRSSFQFVRPRDLKYLEDFKILSDVAGSNVSFFSVTSDFTFSYNDRRLDRYEKILSENLSGDFNSQVSVEIHLAESLPYCAQSFTIIVLDKGKVVYQAFFLVLVESADRNEKDFKGVPNDSLPIICVTKKGPKQMFTKIHGYFELTFKCRMIEPTFDSDNFLWAWGILANETIRRKLNSGMTVKYHVPDTPESVSILFHMDKDSLKSAWTCTRTIGENIMTYEEIQQFICSFETHVRNIYGVKLSYFDVRSIKFEGAVLSVNKDNTFNVKITDMGVFYTFLLFLRVDIFQKVRGNASD